MVEHWRVHGLRRGNAYFGKRDRGLTDKQDTLHCSLNCGRYSSSRTSEFESGRNFGGFSEIWHCNDTR